MQGIRQWSKTSIEWWQLTASGVAFYSEPQLKTAMASFLGRFEITHTISQTMRTTEEISMAYRIAYRDLWRMLGNGDIKRIGHIPDEGLIKGIRLEVADVLEALTGVADALTTNQAADILGVINHDVSNLAVNGKLPTLPLRSDIPTKLLHVFDAAVIKSFDAEFMSRTVFCKLLGRQLSVETLRARGLKPAIELDSQFTRGARAVFYRREEAVRFIAAA